MDLVLPLQIADSGVKRWNAKGVGFPNLLSILLLFDSCRFYVVAGSRQKDDAKDDCMALMRYPDLRVATALHSEM